MFSFTNKNYKIFIQNKSYLILAIIIFALFAIFGYSGITGKQNNSGIETTSASSVEPADINSDNKVDIVDLSILLSNWSTSDNLSDLNDDNAVDIVDLSILLSKWGNVVAGYPSPAGWQISWTDEFNGSSIDTSLWGVYDPDNGKGRYGDGDPLFLPCLVKENAIVNGGSLTIKSKKEQVACNKGITAEYSSAFIGSRDANNYYPLYGRYEIRAKIPHGQGIWPAFWLRHVNGSSAAEVDILEVFHATDPGTVTQSLHFPNSISTNVAKKGTIFETAVVGTGEWHIFAVDIEQVYAGRDDTVKFSFWVDNKKTLEYTNTNASSWAGLTDKSRAWDIAINTAVGGTYSGNPDESLGWYAGGGGSCTLERPQRVTTDKASCSKERTPGKWYNSEMTSAPAKDGVDDIWFAPWYYNSSASADFVLDYIRFYIKQ